MEINNKINIHNRFDIEVRNKNTGELKQKAVAYNIVLNQMYTRLCGGLSYFANIHFGSGTGTLSASRTSLFTHLGTKTAVDEQIIKAIPLSTWKRKIVLNPEEYVGNTISEVGVAFGATSTNLVTHSLLKDSEGNPISIVKTDTDVITIYATVFVTFDNSNPNLVYINMPSSNTLVNYLIGGATAPTGAFSLNDIFLGSSRLGTTGNVTWTSDTVNKQRKTNVLRFGTTVGNGQVKFLEFANVFSLEFPYSSVFNGQNYEGVTLGVGDGVIDTFEIPSANLKDVSLVVKKNGVATIDFSIINKLGVFRTYMSLDNTRGDLPGTMSSISRNGLALGSLYRYGLDLWRLVNGVWVKTNGLSAGSDYHRDVAFSHDGNVVAGCSSVSPFIVSADWNGSSWVARPMPDTKPTADTQSCSISSDGGVVAFVSGTTIFVYDWIGGVYVKRPNPNLSGGSNSIIISLSADGNSIGYSTNNATYKYGVLDWDGSSWVHRPVIAHLGGGGYGCALNEDGSIFVVGLGSVVPYFDVLEWDGVSWTRRAIGTPSSMTQSLGVGISEDGNQVTVVGYGPSNSARNHVYAYENGEYKFVMDFYSTLWSYGGDQTASGDMITITNSNFTLVFKRLSYKKIKFNTPPSIGDVITADYTVDGVHKTDQYVIDASFAIQFGEGV